jgi:hypothetical protein
VSIIIIICKFLKILLQESIGIVFIIVLITFFCNIKSLLTRETHPKFIGYGELDWIGLAQDRYRWRALVNAVMNLQVP